MINNTTVTTSATEVLEAPTKPFSFVAISNNGSATAYLKVVAGGDAVTTSNGIPLAPGAAFVVDQDQQARLFSAGVTAIVETGTTVIGVQAH